MWGSGSGLIRNFFLATEWFVQDPDPAKTKEQIKKFKKFILGPLIPDLITVVWNRKWQIVGRFFFSMNVSIFFYIL